MASTLGQLIPLLIAIALLGGTSWVLYQIYLSLGAVRASASERMTRSNVVFTKDGVRVGVRGMQNEKYVDKTQSYVVKAWNLGTAQRDDEMKRKGSK
ncbi:hypothetical protein M440DRAFT_1400094 [Trichoderma longibrachiatum ATCC 18648]|uniref:Uncharacterized protein n=1 Tax=Trichoderma longibrachiatum ATCC 18648 TaxID=983965 RepID=A0A2T4C6K8_TRILO|nr:hypothetical protein M440DRAFT_1400094 [Trichoderma longibrachiatum ATCC 18648]